MSEEGFCETHGPYDASLGACPYCQRESPGVRPAAPPPLEDEEETSPWPSGAPPAQAGYYYDEDELETEPGRRGRRDALALEEEEETEFPRRRRALLEDWDEEATEIERAPTGMLGWLIVKDGARRGKIYSIRNGTTIGRKEADVLIKDSKISRVHAKFTVEEGHFVVWDFGTPNGTFVNGTRIREATPLNENDVIKIGDTSLVLKTLEE